MRAIETSRLHRSVMLVAMGLFRLMLRGVRPAYLAGLARQPNVIVGALVARLRAANASGVPASDNTVVVIVGDRKVIEPGLKAANIGPVIVVDEKGNPVGG